MVMLRPNILCIVSEDCPPRLGAYGDPLARTPNLDRLAHRGVTFDAACCVSPVCAPSRFSILTGCYPESVPPAQQMTAWGAMPADVRTYPEVMRAAGYYCTNNSKTHYNVDIDAVRLWDDCSGTAHWAGRPAGKPFLSVFNCMLTHESCVFEERLGAVEPHDVTLAPHLPDLPELRRDLASYYNRIEEMDAWMGDRLAELDAAGLSEDTIVIYYSDHGSPLPRSKRFCYDDGLRVPLIVHVPERWRHMLPAAAGSRVSEPVSLLDLFQTFTAIAGIDAPKGVQGVPFIGESRKARDFAFSGRDRMDSRYDLTRSARGARYRYVRNYSPHRIYGQYYSYAWLAQGYQAYEAAHLKGELDPVQERFWQRKPAEELYDMWIDPDSIHNLAGEPAHAETLADMRRALDSHMLSVHDCGFIPERSPVEAEAARHDPVLYPLKRVLMLANRAIECNPANMPDFVAGLRELSPVMRYWAAQGLLILAVDGHAMPADLHQRIDEESDPDVLIALLDAWGHAGSAEAAVRRLTDLATDDHSLWIRLKALAALTDLPLFPGISLDVVAAAAEEPGQYIRGAAGYLKLKLEGSYEPGSKIFRYDLFLKHMEGHSGIGPQSFPELSNLRSARHE